MTGVQDHTQPYETKRCLLGNMSLRDLRISMLRSRGLLEGDETFLQQQDDVLKGLNGSSQTPLRQYLEDTLYRPPYKK